MSLPTLKFGILELLTCLSLGLTSSGQVGLGPYERLVEEADVIAFAEILSTDDTRMAADGPGNVSMYGEVSVWGGQDPQGREGSTFAGNSLWGQRLGWPDL